jgi:ATP-dependent helicase/nuclease subunit A
MRKGEHMSEKKKFSWTPQQETAITERNKTLLVSAAAGSGKTATLTERIIRRITVDGADISNMLIVTFTRASAADLRTKIFKAISDALAAATDKEAAAKLSSQLTKLNNAKICTIDSFYYDLVKEHFSDAEVSPTFRIIDGSEYTLISKRIMNDVIDEFYENEESFPIFAECFASVRAQNSLCDVFLGIHSSLSSTTDGVEFLKKCAAKAFEDSKKDLLKTSYGELLKREIKLFSHKLKI